MAFCESGRVTDPAFCGGRRTDAPRRRWPVESNVQVVYHDARIDEIKTSQTDPPQPGEPARGFYGGSAPGRRGCQAGRLPAIAIPRGPPGKSLRRRISASAFSAPWKIARVVRFLTYRGHNPCQTGAGPAIVVYWPIVLFASPVRGPVRGQEALPSTFRQTGLPL